MAYGSCCILHETFLSLQIAIYLAALIIARLPLGRYFYIAKTRKGAPWQINCYGHIGTIIAVFAANSWRDTSTCMQQAAY